MADDKRHIHSSPSYFILSSFRLLLAEPVLGIFFFRKEVDFQPTWAPLPFMPERPISAQHEGH